MKRIYVRASSNGKSTRRQVQDTYSRELDYLENTQGWSTYAVDCVIWELMEFPNTYDPQVFLDCVYDSMINNGEYDWIPAEAHEGVDLLSQDLFGTRYTTKNH